MALAGFSPTRTTASPGGRLIAASAAIRGFSSFLMSSRTRFPSRTRGILLNHNVRGSGSVTMNRRIGIELRAQGFSRRLRFPALESLVQIRRNREEFAVTRLPDFEERTRIETPFDRPAPVQTLLKRLADKVLLQAFAAGVFEDGGEPQE